MFTFYAIHNAVTDSYSKYVMRSPLLTDWYQNWYRPEYQNLNDPEVISEVIATIMTNNGATLTTAAHIYHSIATINDSDNPLSYSTMYHATRIVTALTRDLLGAVVAHTVYQAYYQYQITILSAIQPFLYGELPFSNEHQIKAFETGKLTVEEALQITTKDQLDAFKIEKASASLEPGDVNDYNINDLMNKNKLSFDTLNKLPFDTFNANNNSLYVEISGENSNTTQIEAN